MNSYLDNVAEFIDYNCEYNIYAVSDLKTTFDLILKDLEKLNEELNL